MSTYVALKNGNEIVMVMKGMDLQQAQMSVDAMEQGLTALELGSEFNDIDEEVYYIDEGVPALRPDKPPSVDQTGMVPFLLDLTPYAEGSTVTITNQDGETLDIADMSAEISLTDTGLYKVSVSQPFPHHELRYEVTVT